MNLIPRIFFYLADRSKQTAYTMQTVVLTIYYVRGKYERERERDRFVLPGGEDVGRKGEAILSPGLTREKAELELRNISLPPCQTNILKF